MPEPPNNRSQLRYLSLANFVASTVIVFSVLNLYGWIENIPFLKTFGDTRLITKPLTSISFILLSIATLACFRERPNRFLRVLSRTTCILAFLIGVGSLVQHVFHVDLFFDGFLFENRADMTDRYPFGLMSPGSAINLTVLSLALFIGFKLRNPHPRAAQLLSIYTFFAGYLSVTGYLLQTQYTYGIAAIAQMPVLSSAFFILMPLSILIGTQSHGIAKLVKSKAVGGTMLRQLLVWTMLLPPLVSITGSLGRQAGLFDASFETLFVLIGNTAVLVLALFHYGRIAEEIDLRRISAEKELARQKIFFEAVFNCIPDGLFVTTTERKFSRVNPAGARMFGYSQDELIGMPTRSLYGSEEDYRKIGALLRPDSQLVHGEVVEVSMKRKDGSAFPGELTSAALTQNSHDLMGFMTVARDITLRKKANEEIREREKLLTAFANSVSQLIWIADRDGKVFFANRRLYDYIGRGPDFELDPENPLLIHPEDTEIFSSHWKKARETTTEYSVQARVPDRFGKYRWFLVRATPFIDDRGELRYWFGTCTDIDQQIKRQEKALRLQGLAQRLSLALTPDSVANAVVSETCTILSVSGAALFLRTDDTPTQVRVIASCGDSGTAQSWTENAPGTFGLPVRTSHEEIGTLWVRPHEGQDLTPEEKDLLKAICDQCGAAMESALLHEAEQKALYLANQAQKQLEGAVQQLELEGELRERFVATLSHDLKNPLTAAKMAADLLSSRGDSEKVRENFVPRIKMSMARMDQMIQNLLDVNLLKAGQQLPITPELCDTRQLTKEALNDLETIYGDRFDVKIRIEEPIFCDRRGMIRVVQNLLANAVKYGDPERRITLWVEDIGHEVRMAVHNFGDPIPEHEIPHLFEMFHRAPSAMKSGTKGWGLGLALVKGIVDAHGGRIAVTSDARDGTTFTVFIPGRPEARPSPPSDDQIRPVVGRSDSPSPLH